MTLTLALRFLRQRRPLGALALAGFAPAALMVATGLAVELRDPLALLLLYAVAGLAVLAAFLGLVYALAAGVSERAADLAALREAGAAQAQLRRLVLAEGLILAGLGTVAGILIGLVLAGLAGKLSAPFLIASLTVALGGGLLLGGIASLIAARRATGP